MGRENSLSKCVERVVCKSKFSQIHGRQWQGVPPERQAEEGQCDPAGSREPQMVLEQVHSGEKVLVMSTRGTVTGQKVSAKWPGRGCLRV